MTVISSITKAVALSGSLEVDFQYHPPFLSTSRTGLPEWVIVILVKDILGWVLLSQGIGILYLGQIGIQFSEYPTSLLWRKQVLNPSFKIQKSFGSDPYGSVSGFLYVPTSRSNLPIKDNYTHRLKIWETFSYEQHYMQFNSMGSTLLTFDKCKPFQNLSCPRNLT